MKTLLRKTDAPGFVIMPFTVRQEDLPKYLEDKEHWSQVYEGLIKPAFEKAQMTCQRDDEDTASRAIADNIWRKIDEAELVLCDLSSFNPNVFLELGWAMRADKRFVLIKDDLTSFPFDLNQHFTFTYSHKLQPKTLVEEVGKLATVLAQTMEDRARRYSIPSRLALLAKAQQESEQGNVEIQLLNEVLSQVRALRNEPGLSSFGAPQPPHRATVQIYWHESGLTLKDAVNMENMLKGAGFRVRVKAHVDSSPPDAAFIGALVGAEDARVVLDNLPYRPQYLFRPDYPEAEGGSDSGCLIGVGYMASHYRAHRGSASEPVSITPAHLKALRQPGLSNTAFQQRLRELTLP